MTKKLIPYMSYWSKGYQGNPSDFVLNLHKLCFYFLKKNFGEVHFITDSESFDYFKFIPWTSISTDLDGLTTEYENVWSVSKLFVYKIISQKGNPFFHVDYDVFLPEGLEERILNSDIFAQCTEYNSMYYYKINDFLKNCPNPYEIKNIKVQDAINVGVLGGNDVEFINKYSTEALEMVFNPVNKNYWLSYDDSTHWLKAVTAEQYYLSVLVEKYKKNIEYIFPNGWPTEEEAKEKKFIHLMGFKQNKQIHSVIEGLTKKYIV
jgi:hypothetical protein